MNELYRNVDIQFDRTVVDALEGWLIGERKLRADWRSRLEIPTTDNTLAAAESSAPVR